MRRRASRRLYADHNDPDEIRVLDPVIADVSGHSLRAMPNLADILSHSAAAHPHRTAIKLDDGELSYAELERSPARSPGCCAPRARPGDRVGVMLPNVPHFPAAYYGALRLGATVVPMNVLLKEREVAFYLGDSEAKVLLAWHEFADAAHPGPSRRAPSASSSSRVSSTRCWRAASRSPRSRSATRTTRR